MHGQVHSIFWGMLRHRAQVSGHHLQVHPTWAHWIMIPGCEIKEVAHPGKDQELKRGLMGSGAKAQGPSFQSGRPLRRGGNPSGLCVKPPCALPRHCARLGANWKGRSQSPGVRWLDGVVLVHLHPKPNLCITPKALLSLPLAR